MKIRQLSIVVLLPLAACNQPSPQNQETAQRDAPAIVEDSTRFEDVEAAGGAFTPPPNLAIEVALDRLGFSSGVIDGKPTRLDDLALRGFQAANDLAVSGKLDEATRAALSRAPVEPLRTVRIPQGFAQGPFVPDLPAESGKQAGFDHLGYRNLMEALAERFHTTPETIVSLNGPDARIGAGTVIRVPNVADVDTANLKADERGWSATLAALGVAPVQPQADKLVVSKSKGSLRAFDSADKLLAQFPVTTGSEHDPLPIGNWKILGVSRNPDFHYNPKLFWDVSDKQPDRLLKPGPNGPVGVVWLDLSKDHYGIHGTGEPASIGHSESHGCVRLTNWDAARLAQMVKPGVSVVFEE
ncbi:L,D-transpeptidase family protein [Novosphingobium sp. PS1R-30]|uniref:L,D-transpeptidase family protein n=1 Tax=Novosphingobium anseongense TaxID=3133436 RepID=A0ABU8S1W4_9SPHN